MFRPVEPLTAIDLFAGAGGASEGLRQAGYKVVGAVESDLSAVRTYTHNHAETDVQPVDILQIEPANWMEELGLRPGALALLKACPPCQGHSTLGLTDADDPRNDLILSVWPFVRSFRPCAVAVENVPGIASDRRLESLVRKMRSVGYGVRHYSVQATDYGVPQRRRRHIVLAVAGVPASELPSSLPGTRKAPSAGAILEMVERQARTADPLDVHRSLRPVTAERVAAVPPAGNHLDLPERLRLGCHTRLRTRSATSVYGRIDPEAPAPTMTTRCTTPSCGRFIHPTEDRGLTLREAASFQTFPQDYDFVGGYDSIERQIGNALPVELGRVIGETVAKILGDES